MLTAQSSAAVTSVPAPHNDERHGHHDKPDADVAAPLDVSDSSGMSRGLVAAVVAGLAAVVTLGGAGWYARRRLTD